MIFPILKVPSIAYHVQHNQRPYCSQWNIYNYLFGIHCIFQWSIANLLCGHMCHDLGGNQPANQVVLSLWLGVDVAELFLKGFYLCEGLRLLSGSFYNCITFLWYWYKNWPFPIFWTFPDFPDLLANYFNGCRWNWPQQFHLDTVKPRGPVVW